MKKVFADTGYWVALLNPSDDLNTGCETKFFNSRKTCSRAKAELTFRTPWRFSRTPATEEPAGFGVCARQRRFPAGVHHFNLGIYPSVLSFSPRVMPFQ